MKRLMAICAAAVLAGGCFNLTVRPQTDVNQGPYFCTKTDQKAIRKGWNGGGGPYSVLLPVFVLDWPLEAVCDTVLLPYDLIMSGRHGFLAPAPQDLPKMPEPITFELNY